MLFLATITGADQAQTASYDKTYRSVDTIEIRLRMGDDVKEALTVDSSDLLEAAIKFTRDGISEHQPDISVSAKGAIEFTDSEKLHNLEVLISV